MQGRSRDAAAVLTSRLRRFGDRLRGTPWQANAPIDVYWNNSPLKDVSKVKTPTIFLEWFEKYIHNRAYVWEKIPGDEKKDTPKPTTSAPQ